MTRLLTEHSTGGGGGACRLPRSLLEVLARIHAAGDRLSAVVGELVDDGHPGRVAIEEWNR